MLRLMPVKSAVVATAAVLLGALAAVPAPTAHGDEGRVVAAPAVRGLLLRSESPRKVVTIVTLAGKQIPVPARVRESPLGLSPDARLLARVSAPARLRGGGAVLVGPIRSGPMKIVVRGDCTSPPCPYGADPSFAWSPDSQRLAAAATPAQGPTMLKLSDRNGRVVRSFMLPRRNAQRAERVYHHLESWSPDGSRLLLTQSNDYGPTAVLVLDVKTGRSRTLGRSNPCDAPRVAWSPDGRFVALTSSGTQDCDDHFAVIESTSARRVLQRSPRKGEGQGETVWAPDSRSVFATVVVPTQGSDVLSRIDRVDLAGRRTNVISSRAGWLIPRLGLRGGLVYQTSPYEGYGALYLHRFVPGNGDLLISSQKGIDAVLPLARLP